MCSRVFLRWHCSEDSPRKIYFKYLALCQALSKCLKNRSCSSHSYFRLRNSSNITGIIVHWRELKAKVWSCMVTQLLGEGQSWGPIPCLHSGLSFLLHPTDSQDSFTSAELLSTSLFSSLPPLPLHVSTSNIRTIPKSCSCYLQNILSKFLLLSYLMDPVVILSRRFSPPLYPWLAPLSFSSHVSTSERLSATILAQVTPSRTFSFSLSSLWPVRHFPYSVIFFPFHCLSYFLNVSLQGQKTCVPST